MEAIITLHYLLSIQLISALRDYHRFLSIAYLVIPLILRLLGLNIRTSIVWKNQLSINGQCEA